MASGRHAYRTPPENHGNDLHSLNDTTLCTTQPFLTDARPFVCCVPAFFGLSGEWRRSTEPLISMGARRRGSLLLAFSAWILSCFFDGLDLDRPHLGFLAVAVMRAASTAEGDRLEYGEPGRIFKISKLSSTSAPVKKRRAKKNPTTKAHAIHTSSRRTKSKSCILTNSKLGVVWYSS